MIRLVSGEVLHIPSGKPLSDSRQVKQYWNNKAEDVSQSFSLRQLGRMFLHKTCQVLNRSMKRVIAPRGECETKNRSSATQLLSKNMQKVLYSTVLFMIFSFFLGL